MDDEKLEEKTKEEILQDTIDDLTKKLDIQVQCHRDLVEYLEKTDPNFKTSQGTFDNWSSRLANMRHEEQRQKEIADARQVLEGAGYIVAKDVNSLDAAKVKHWINTPIDDDDIPF